MQAQKFKMKMTGKNNWKNFKRILHHQGMFYILEIIETELIHKYHNESTLTLKQFRNLFPGNILEICSCSQFLHIIRRAPITSLFLLLLIGL